MKFELVEPADWKDSGPSPTPREGGADLHSERLSPWPPLGEITERMGERNQALGSRLTSAIEAVRPLLARLDAAIVRTEQEMAGTGHRENTEAPDTFHPERFSPVGGRR
ncbi:hypothetical protein ACOALZ_03805 [Nocardiopsis algeriensis]|uniref:hypothetical protein n=1 Tax=Nocardiopsis algeriensis TaxID=1478215 RepID=UPI003B439C24